MSCYYTAPRSADRQMQLFANGIAPFGNGNVAYDSDRVFGSHDQNRMPHALHRNLRLHRCYRHYTVW
jgi:hypothetical protein